MTAYRVPEGYDYAGLHDFLKAAGFIIYAGQGRFNGEVFRIAVMGDLDATDTDRLLTACRRFWERSASVLS
jgi:2-aminoethylphosphonate-pyruvate transaminase